MGGSPRRRSSRPPPSARRRWRCGSSPPAAGQAITAQLVSATDDLANSYATYFGTIGVVTLAIAGVFFLVTPWITRHIREGEEA